MGTGCGDLDNDGFMDFYFGTGQPDLRSLVPNIALHNVAAPPGKGAGGRMYMDVTTAAGMGHLQKGHGIGMADLDNDGDVDVMASFGGMFHGDRFFDAFFLNPGVEETSSSVDSHSCHTKEGKAKPNNWAKISLHGTQANRQGIGARLTIIVERDAYSGNTSTIYRTVDTGGSFGSNPVRQEVGLGQAHRIKSIHVKWPIYGWPEQLFTDLPVDSWLTLRQDSEVFQVKPLKQLLWNKEELIEAESKTSCSMH
jgi:hypothetical protein